MKSNNYKNLLNDTLLFAIGAVGSKIIIFALLPLYTTILSTSDYGLADLVFTAGELIRPVISLGIANGLLRFGLSKENRMQDAFRCSFAVFIISSIVLVLVTPLFRYYSSVFEWKWYITFYVISLFASKNALIYLKVMNKNRLYSILNILQAVLLGFLNIILLCVFKAGIQGYLIANTLAPLIVACIAFCVGHFGVEIRNSKVDKKLYKNMIRYSLPFVANDLSWWIINSSDKVMINSMINASQLGLYSVASKIPMLITVVTGIFTQAWDLSVIREYEDKNDDGYYKQVNTYFFVFLFGVTIIIALFSKLIVNLFIGGEFQSAWRFIPLLAFATAFSSEASFAGSFLSATKKSKIIMISTLISGLLNLAINLVLIRYIGVWGAIVGTIVSQMVVYFVRCLYIKNNLRINLFSRKMLMATLIVLFQCIVISLDFYIYAMSILVIIAFSLLFRKEMVCFLELLKTIVCRRKEE